ncbi:hypothetical protein M9Y10_041436 [Tritrichomonas musculus]|uniref:Uncharacterized protein n=1 Tax=Tritrichomonas musculus TaxID=1915356 RepID=A0ABR2K655_9EUKA
MPTCVKNVTKKYNEDDYTFETYLGESLNIDDISSTIFWIFKTFSECFIITPPPGSKSKVNPKSRLRPSTSTQSSTSNNNTSNTNDTNNTDNTNTNAQLVPSGSFNLADSFVP